MRMVICIPSGITEVKKEQSKILLNMQEVRSLFNSRTYGCSIGIGVDVEDQWEI